MPDNNELSQMIQQGGNATTVTPTLPPDNFDVGDEDAPIDPKLFESSVNRATTPANDTKALADKARTESKAAASTLTLEQEKELADAAVPPTALIQEEEEPEDITVTQVSGKTDNQQQQQPESSKQPQEWNIFKKKMASDAGAWVEARLKELDTFRAENKTLKETAAKGTANKSGVPNNWYEHPQAFALTPEYQQGYQFLQQLNGALDHYQQQLVNIKEGDEWFDLIQDEHGNISQSKGIKPGAASEVKVLNRIANARQAINSQQVAVNQIQSRFAEGVSEYRSGMKNVEDYYFPQFADSEKLKGNNDYQAVMGVLSKNSLNNDRLSGLVAKLYTWGVALSRENGNLKKGVTKTSTLKQMQKAAGPTMEMVNNGGNTSVVSDDDIPVDMALFTKNRNR